MPLDLTPELKDKFRRILNPQKEEVALPPLPKQSLGVQVSSPEAGLKTENLAPKEPVLEPTTLNLSLPEYRPNELVLDDLTLSKERLKFLRDKEFGLVTDPNEPEPQRNPIRKALESKVKGFKDPFKLKYGPDDELRPTVKWEDLDPESQAVVKGLYEDTQIFADPFKDDEETYTRKVREGQSNWIKNAARIISKSENWAPFFNRLGAALIKGGTVGIVNTTEEAKKQVDDLGEQWLRESALPEFTGEVSGALASGPTLKAGSLALNLGGTALKAFAPFIFGLKATNAARKAAQTVGAASEISAATRIGSQVVKGAAAEGTLGFAIGLAGDPDEGETRIDNAIHDALIFAGLGSVIRGGVEVAKIRNDARLSKAVTKLSEDLKVSPVEAEGIILSRTGASRIKDVPPQKVEDLPRESLKEGLETLSTNKGVVELSKRKNITLLDAAKEIQKKNPEAPLDLKLFRMADDAESSVDSYKNFFSKHIIGEVDGQATFMPGHRFLENSGKWLYDTEGLALAPGLKIKGARDIRRFLFGEKSAAKDAFLADKRKILSTSASLQQDALSLVKDIESKVPKLAKEKGVPEQAIKGRLTQIFEGSTTQDPALKYLGEQYFKVHGGLEKDLRELGVLGDTRFLQKTKAKIQKLESDKKSMIDKISGQANELSRPRLIKELNEKEFDTVDDLKKLLSEYGVKAAENDATKLHDAARFIRSSYRNAGRQHLKIFYDAHVQGRKSALGFYLKRNAGPQNLARFKERLDLPEDVRESLGEIEDVTYRAGKTIYEQIDAVQRGRFQEAISRNAAISMPAKGLEAERLIKEESWVKIPKDEKWGAISDHVVAPHVYDDLKSLGMTPTHMSPGTKAAIDGYKKLLQAWKFGKVVLNPSTHMRNMMSNSILLDMSGLGFKEQAAILPKAAKELFNKGEIYKEAQGLGLFGSEFISQEVQGLIESSLKKSSSHLEGLQQAFSVAASPGFLKRSFTKLGQIYQAEDQVFKLAKYMHMRGQGFSQEAAIKETEKWIFNYSDVPEAVRLAKDYYSPFITFVSKATPRFFETVIERPWKLAKYGIYFNAIGNIDTAVQELDQSQYGMVNTLANFMPDSMKRETYAYPQWRTESVLPEWAQTNLTTLGWPLGWLPKETEKAFKETGQTIPRLVRMPFQDKYGRELWLDLTYILPFGDIGEKGSRSVLDIPRVLFPQNPLLDIAQGLSTNEDPFFGKEITFEGDPLKAQKYMQFIGKTALPNLFPGGYSWDKLVSSIKKQEDQQFRLKSLPIALLDVSLGLKLRPFDPEEELVYRLKEKERTIQDMEQAIRKLGEMNGRNMISDEELEEKIDLYVQSIENIANEMGVLSNFGKE